MSVKLAISKFINKSDFHKAYGLWDIDKYRKFIEYVEEKFGEVIDYETSIDNLYIKVSWNDNGGNIHATVCGSISRRDQKSECGGEIVWLKRLKTFRGNCWSRLDKKSDFDYFEEARKYFYYREYHKFLAISKFIEIKYHNNRPFRRMCEIAKARV